MRIVQFGRPTPWRGIIVSCLIGGGATLLGTVFGLLSPHPEHTPLMLMFLLIPLTVAPLLIVLNRYAEFDVQTGLIRINGAPPVPLTHITHAKTMVFRGVSSLDLGTGPKRNDRFIVANGLFGSPKIEREWIRRLLPHMGLPRQGFWPDHWWQTRQVSAASSEEAITFAHEWLK
ncbi:hypothetical protein [Humidisolicoccus flavus]|uniref:hypothetical protein n=1 Tax=Humidisolicoccus flavus TaxID=3111414 RepID=UPI003254F0F5